MTRTDSESLSSADEPTAAAALDRLTSHPGLVAEILSHLVGNTADLARLRLLSSSWNRTVVPFVLVNRPAASHLGCCCHDGNRFVEGLVRCGEETLPVLYGDLSDRDEDYEFGGAVRPFREDVRVRSLVVVADEEEYGAVEVRVRGEDGYARRAAELADRRRTKRPDYRNLARGALADGIFLSLRQRREAAEEEEEEGRRIATPECDRNEYWDHVPCASVLTVVANAADCVVDRSVPSSPTILFQAKDTREADEDMRLLVEIQPFDQGGRYVGYVVEEVDDHDAFVCHVPILIFFHREIVEEMTQGDVPRLNHLWSSCQERLRIPEGVAAVDGFVPPDLRRRLLVSIDRLADTSEVDYHPHSNNIVRDLVHPSLYSYVQNVSPKNPLPEVPPERFPGPPSSEGGGDGAPPVDYWGRPYESSSRYQWLPSYYDISPHGSCTISDYVNGLVPRGRYQDLYDSLAGLFSHALPLIESVYGYCRAVRPRIRSGVDGNLDYDGRPVDPLEERPVSLRGRRLQVVTKIVDYRLGPSRTYEGVWHVEGMSHEEIVLTCLYVLDRDDDLEGGDVLFRRALHRREAEYIFSTVDQVRPHQVDQLVRQGLLPLGRATTPRGRLLVFPNGHVHRVTEMKKGAGAAAANDDAVRRRIVVFFLVNPERRIVSTREVPPQQVEGGGNMSREDALRHRLELMKERKYTKQDWNVREIELCEH